MTVTIELTTDIGAPIERVFDLARDLDLHARSMAHTGERAIAGQIAQPLQEEHRDRRAEVGTGRAGRHGDVAGAPFQAVVDAAEPDHGRRATHAL